MNESFRGRKRYTTAERAEILAEYRASDLTQREFVAEAGISLACLSIWLRKAKAEKSKQKRAAAGDGSSIGFVPVEVKDDPSMAMPPVPGRIELELPGQLVVRLPEDCSQADAVRFIVQLHQAC
jgi:transposase-like protein